MVTEQWIGTDWPEIGGGDSDRCGEHEPLLSDTVVVTVSTKGKPVPFHIAVNPSGENGLKEASFVKCEQGLTISKDRLVRRLGRLEEQHMQAVAASLRKVLEI